MTKFCSYTVLIGILFVAGMTEATTAARSAGISDEEKKSIEATVADWTKSLEKKNFKKWITFFNKDAVLMPPKQARIVGPKQIEAFMRKNYGDGGVFNLTDVMIEGREDLAIYTSYVGHGQEDLKQLVVLLRDPDGKWKVQKIIFNSNKAM